MGKLCGKCEFKKMKIRNLEAKLEAISDLTEKAMGQQYIKHSPTWCRLYPMFRKILDGDK